MTGQVQQPMRIKAYITKKTPIQTYKKQSGAGVYFNLNLTDESGKIRATVFGNEAKKYHGILKVSDCCLDRIVYIPT